jgi:putative oxidoreductase
LSLSAKSWFMRLIEIILGGLFIYAGYLKLLRPYEFADAVWAYQLLPGFLVGVVAAALPWIETAAGLFLVVGLKRRSCLLILGWLIGTFLLVMLITAARGLKIDCGCGLFFQRQVGPALILEDAFLLLWAAGLYYWELTLVGETPAP